MRQASEELRNESDPVPHRGISLEVFESTCDLSFVVVQTKKPEDSAKQFPGFRALVKASRLQVATNSIASQLVVSRVSLEPLVTILSPFRPRLSKAEIIVESNSKRLIGLIDMIKLGEEHALECVEFSLLLWPEVVQISIINHI